MRILSPSISTKPSNSHPRGYVQFFGDDERINFLYLFFPKAKLKLGKNIYFKKIDGNKMNTSQKTVKVRRVFFHKKPSAPFLLVSQVAVLL